MSVMYERIEAGTLKSRGRCKKDIMRDLLIANAQNTYLTSNQMYEDLETLLKNLSLFAPEFSV